MPRERDISFYPEFEVPMVGGTKTCTSRTYKMGDPGDHFYKWDCRFELLGVVKLPLGYVHDCLFDLEGFLDPQDFEDIWNRIHPLKGFDRKQVVYVHFFRRTE